MFMLYYIKDLLNYLKMMSQDKKLSMKGTIFIFNLRRKIEAKAMRVQDIFTRQIFLRNPKEITQLQFSKLVTLSDSNFSTMEICDIFNELKIGPSISLNYFVNVYNQVISKIPKETKPAVNKTISSQSRELEQKIMKAAFLRLHKRLKENGLEFFDQADERGVGYLTNKELNRLLIATDLRQFNDKQIRNMMIKQIFKYYPTGKITKYDFTQLFKIQPKKQVIPVPEIKIKPQPPKNPIQSPNKQRIQKPFQKLEVPKVYYDDPKPSGDGSNKKNFNSVEKKDQNNDNIMTQAFNARQIFPRAHRYYRLGVPNPDELQFFQALQGFLQQKKVYIDQKNPITHIGSYKQPSEYFKGSKYQIFIMAASVIQRQKSRIGLARQIQPKDIMQGQLGDCYLLSSIASIISFYPEVVFDKILFAVNQAHFYAVKFFIDGQWQFIVTDDQFPCQYGNPVFAKPHGKEIWVMLLQKCWAKVFGSYKAIESGTPTEGFRALSGAPCQFILAEKQEDQKNIKVLLEEAYQKRYVATVSSSKYLESLSQDQQKEIGLISSHAYSFLKFLNINGESIVKMRNPWGKTIWKGQWSFQSKKWTKQLRQKYNYSNVPDDGSFYMPWGQFLKYFSAFVICRVDPTFQHTSLRLKNSQPHKSAYLRIVVNEQGTYNFSIYQQSKRKNVQIKGYQYSSIRLVLVKDCDDHYQYINSVNKQKSHCTSFETSLSKGIYLAAVKVEWESQKIYPLVFNSYGVEKIIVEEIDNTIAPLFKQLLINSYSQKFKGKIKKYQKIGLPDAYNETELSIQRGIGYIRMKNPTNKQFKTVLSMPKYQGLKIMKPYKLPLQFDMKPNKEYIVGIWLSSKGFSYESSEQITYQK